MRRTLVTLALASMLLASLARSQPSGGGIELRIFAGRSVLARRGAPAGGGGEPVRVVSSDGVCDGTLGPNAESPVQDFLGDVQTAMVAPVRGCVAASPLLAILRPRPMRTWPQPVPIDDTDLEAAVSIGQAAAARAGHLRGAVRWEPSRAYRVGDARFVLVTGPAAEAPEGSPSVAALVRVGAPSEVVMVRPAHWLWTEDHLVGCRFSWVGVTDVDGDGTVELLETQIGESAFMLRLVRVASRPEGDVVWTASHRGSPTTASIDGAPRPVAPR